MLYNRRKRQRELAAAEAAGESFWTIKFDEAVRAKIVHALQDAGGQEWERFATIARGLILRDEGRFYLSDADYPEHLDLVRFLLTCDDADMPMVIEALASVTTDTQIAWKLYRYEAGDQFTSTVTVILREHRVAFDLIGVEMVPFSSRELHQDVVVPALQLLAGDSDWHTVETAYQNALTEISKGKPDDAITDAGTALQEALVVLGCKGNSLGPLIKSARERGLLAAHDTPMLDALDRIMNWVSADRSESGDAHAVSFVTPQDAWLMVHVVGALLVRLSAGQPRTTPR